MTQHPVGQGGLFCGELSVGGEPLRWVYDCGSNQSDALSREIESVAADGDLDLLFLSHLDSDHINGIDLLLSRVQVREVVLPYLNEEALVATLVQEAGHGSLRGVFVEAIGDIAGWFGSRGVETITFVDGSEDGEGGDGPIVPAPSVGGGEGACVSKWTRDPVPFSGSTSAPHESTGVANMQRARPGSALIVNSKTNQLNWALIPYVHQPPARLMKAFNDALKAEFGETPKSEIARSAKDPTVREKLRNCYDALWLDHNLISMTLYVGPINLTPVEIKMRTRLLHHHEHWWHEECKASAWMLTGDAKLDGMRRGKRFLEFYKSYTNLIKVLMLPHHGSIHNHSSKVLDAMPNLWLGFAAAGPNKYGHPHKHVRDAVNAHCSAYFHQVNHEQRNRIVMDVSM